MIDSLGDESAEVGPPATEIYHDGVLLNKQRSTKRRKVRKGTKSCWECKRRKIRCIFSSSDDGTCLSCRRRRAPCVSQDLPEDLSPARIGNRHLGARISKVEDLMKEILASKDGETALLEGAPHEGPRHTRPNSARLRSNVPEVSPVQTTSTPSTGYAKFGVSLSVLTPESQSTSNSTNTDLTLAHLLAAFPVDGDAKLLAKESSKTVLYNETVYTQPHNKLTHETFEKLCSEFKLPSRNAHPVIIARCMLIFAITLQNPARDRFLGLSEPQDAIMHRLVFAATTWVTTKEEMQGTVEGLICIILEGIFEINCGNLRRGWAVYRRAMTAAQLLGLHRSIRPVLKYLDSWTTAQPEALWFRIIHMDRYLSLLLGLPQGISEKNVPPWSVWENEPPLGRFERILTIMASRILDRNESAYHHRDHTTTQSIDSELLKLSRSMPASFWRPVNFHGFALGEPDTYLETLRLGAQVYYYSLLIQLHLPFMIRTGDNNGHAYAKNACVNASREILARFIAHRSFNPASSCSRPVDFFALLAAMTLSLAHLDSHYHRTTTNFLAHQRSSDRAILDQALETMDAISHMNEDKITEKSAIVVRRLLEIEADASDGGDYITSVVGGDVNRTEGEKEGNELRLNIPYLGTIKISRQGFISCEPTHRPSYIESIIEVSTLGRASTFHERPICPLNDSDPNSMIPASSMYSNRPTAQQTLRDEEAILDYPNLSQDMTIQQPDALAPIVTDVDDWTFQGVDVAFFDSLMRGTSGIDAELEQQWIENPL